MKFIYMRKALLFSLLVSSAIFANIEDRIEYKLNRILRDTEIIVNGNTAHCTPITQADINRGEGTYTITQSGEYCLAHDVVGSIAISADCVSINLNSHTVDAGGTFSAFTAGGHQGIKIFNGSIINSPNIGIIFESCTAVELFNLNVFGHAGDTCIVNGCAEINIHNINFFDSKGLALVVIESENINVASSTFSGFDQCNFAVIEVFGSSCVTIRDIDAIDNCAEGIIALVDSHDIAILDSRLSTNDALAGILLLGVCSSCTVIRCQSNDAFYGIVAPSGIFTNLAFIDCICENNNIGFVLNENSCCLIQDCTAINNVVGFEDFSSPLTTTYIGNVAQCSSTGYDIVHGEISLQGLDLSTGDLVTISGNADLGARFTNIYAFSVL